MNRILRIRKLAPLIPRVSTRSLLHNPEVDEEGNRLKKKLKQEENLYKILEVPRFATTEEIKRQYRHLVKIHHPDRGGDEELFLKINEAYKILNDPEKRKQYNMKKRDKEEKRIFVDSKSKEELRHMKLSEMMEKTELSYRHRSFDGFNLILGLGMPKPAAPLFAKMVPFVLLADIGLMYAFMSGNFDLIIDDFTTYISVSPNGAEGHTLRYSFFTLVNTFAILATAFWSGCHHYFVKMVQHLNYPTFMCYSISYNENKDEMVLILADSDKSKMWSPRRLFVTVKEASKIDFEPGLDNVDHGIGGRIKTISFDLPCVHKFGIQHLKTAFFEKTTKENSSRARQAELIVEQLKAKHLVVHIPHNLALNRNVSIPTNVPLFDYLEKRNFVRKSSTFYSFLGHERSHRRADDPNTQFS